MNKIYAVDSICLDRRSVCDDDGYWSLHKTRAGAEAKLAKLSADPRNSNYSFIVVEVELED